MRLIFIVILLAAVYSDEISSCTVYQCKELKENCANITLKNVELKPCPKNKICDFKIGFGLIKCSDHIKFLYPGEYCNDSSQCLGSQGNCINNHCKGRTKGESCFKDEDCDPKFFCQYYQNQDHKCQETAKNDFFCNESIKCDSGLICANNVCVKIASKSINNSAYLPAECDTLSLNKKDRICIQGSKLQSNSKVIEPVKCVGECNYKGTIDYKTGCTCGLTEEPTLFCNPGIGDIDIADVFFH